MSQQMGGELASPPFTKRETFRDEDCVRVHPIITKGGDLVNVVPSVVRMETYVRAKTPDALLDAGDLSQLIPVLHPMMTGACGSHHQTDWDIADKESGYVNPSRSMAMMAVALLSQDARRARHVLDNFTLGMSKAEYLDRQKSVFRTAVFS